MFSTVSDVIGMPCDLGRGGVAVAVAVAVDN